MPDEYEFSPMEVLNSVLPLINMRADPCPFLPEHCFLNTDTFFLHARDCTCASDRSFPFSIASLVVHLNDDHEWSRQAIADWLESLDVDLSFNPTEGEA